MAMARMATPMAMAYGHTSMRHGMYGFNGNDMYGDLWVTLDGAGEQRRGDRGVPSGFDYSKKLLVA